VSTLSRDAVCKRKHLQRQIRRRLKINTPGEYLSSSHQKNTFCYLRIGFEPKISLCRLLRFLFSRTNFLQTQHSEDNIKQKTGYSLEICAHCQKHKSDLENATALESDAVRYKIRGVIQNAPQQGWVLRREILYTEIERLLCLCVLLSAQQRPRADKASRR
jgi:hypothetical protein